MAHAVVVAVAMAMASAPLVMAMPMRRWWDGIVVVPGWFMGGVRGWLLVDSTRR